MSPPLVQQVRATALSVLVAALLATGLATGALLHWQAVKSQDKILLAAAEAWSQSLGQDGSSPWHAEHGSDPIHLSLSTVPDANTPAQHQEDREDDEDEADEHARFSTVDGRRELRLPIEIESGSEGKDTHAVILATSPAVTLASSAGTFATAYGLVAALVAVLGGGILVRRLETAVAPLAHAGRDVSSVARAGLGARVIVQGPAEVQDLLVEVNALLERLDVAFSAQARFTSEAAHELRTPVTVLRGELDLAMRATRSPQETATTLARLSEQVDRLARLVSGLMALAHIDAGHATEAATDVPVAALVAAAAHQEAPTLRECGCELSVDLGRLGAATVRIHEALGIAALANLLRNAAVHARAKPTRITAEATGSGSDQSVLLHVDDGGPGIAPADREAVFDRLHRGPGLRADGTALGLGLGLSLAREVARQFGGDCIASDSPLGGARITMRLARSS